LSIRPTVGQNFALRTNGSGNAACSRGYGCVQLSAATAAAGSKDVAKKKPTPPAPKKYKPAAVALKAPHLEWVVVGGLGVFGFAFAVNSSVHSYLILAYAGSEKAAEDVGFYYAANALGRFFGTLLSGLLYQWGGLLFSLSGSAAMLVTCWLITLALPDKLTVNAAQAR
jgi:hypothetical protein